MLEEKQAVWRGCRPSRFWVEALGSSLICRRAPIGTIRGRRRSLAMTRHRSSVTVQRIRSRTAWSTPIVRCAILHPRSSPLSGTAQTG